LPAALEELGLEPPLKTLVVVGGAERMSADEMTRARPVIEALGDLAKRVGAVVVDGGTDEGVMRLLGQARARGRSFPLIGVVVASLAAKPPGVAAWGGLVGASTADSTWTAADFACSSETGGPIIVPTRMRRVGFSPTMEERSDEHVRSC